MIRQKVNVEANFIHVYDVWAINFMLRNDHAFMHIEIKMFKLK